MIIYDISTYKKTQVEYSIYRYTKDLLQQYYYRCIIFSGHIPPKQTWLTAAKGKGLEISGTWSRSAKLILYVLENNLEFTVGNIAYHFAVSWHIFSS